MKKIKGKNIIKLFIIIFGALVLIAVGLYIAYKLNWKYNAYDFRLFSLNGKAFISSTNKESKESKLMQIDLENKKTEMLFDGFLGHVVSLESDNENYYVSCSSGTFMQNKETNERTHLASDKWKHMQIVDDVFYFLDRNSSLMTYDRKTGNIVTLADFSDNYYEASSLLVYNKCIIADEFLVDFDGVKKELIHYDKSGDDDYGFLLDFSRDGDTVKVAAKIRNGFEITTFDTKGEKVDYYIGMNQQITTSNVMSAFGYRPSANMLYNKNRKCHYFFDDIELYEVSKDNATYFGKVKTIEPGVLFSLVTADEGVYVHAQDIRDHITPQGRNKLTFISYDREKIEISLY